MHAFIEIIHKWQDLIGAIIGASSAFGLWWVAEKYTQKSKRTEDLYLINKILVDQINSVIDIKREIESFITKKLMSLINQPKTDQKGQYIVNLAFFPLFSVRTISEEFQTKITTSSYVNNKLMRVYALSQDFPQIIADVRRQFEKILEFNKEICFHKLNPPDLQMQTYINVLLDFKNFLQKEILEHNIQVFFKLLVESLIVTETLRSIGSMRWKLKFDSRFRLYLRKKDYLKDRIKTFERIDKYFESVVDAKLEEILSKY